MPEPLRIVHLEDDPNDVILIQETMEHEGIACEVVNASTRSAFVAALEKGSVDLILSDYALPDFDGISALSLARHMAPDAPFILVSGTLGEEAAVASLRNGATDYVLKHRLNRLAPTVLRAVQEAAERKIRRAAEQALDHERKFLRAVLDSLDAGVVACDHDGILTLFNRATRELHGLPEEPLPPDQWASHYRLFHADGKTPLETEAIPLHRALQGEHLRQAEIMILHQNGAPHSVLVSGQPIVDDSGQKLGAVVTMQDITERKQLERQFRQAQKMEAMGRLAAGVAHDFNNLLTVINGYCQLALEKLQPSLPVFGDLAEIAKAGERATGLTQQLLAFSRQQVLEPRVLDLNVVITDVEKMLCRLIGADVEVVFEPGGDLGWIRADAGQIEQVLLNLFVNARDAMTAEGRITIRTANVDVRKVGPSETRGPGGRTEAGEHPAALRPSGEIPPGSYVALTVTDNGCGMDAETSSRIFEPFFTTKDVGKGTGLGLSTVHGIVTQSRGYITVDSEPNRGTSFVIYLPRVAKTEDSAKPAMAQMASGRGKETVLVVDDDRALLGLVGEILRRQGYTVIALAESAAVLELLEDKSREIDAVITDVVMPEMGGRELARRLNVLRPGIPTLFMSGYVGDDLDGLTEILDGRIGFVQKPFAPELLVSKLREVLDGPAAQAA